VAEHHDVISTGTGGGTLAHTPHHPDRVKDAAVTAQRGRLRDRSGRLAPGVRPAGGACDIVA